MKIRKVKKQLKKLIDKKVTPMGITTVPTYVHKIKPIVEFMLKKIGFHYYSENIYTNGTLFFEATIRPYSNLGYNQNGELRLCNTYIHKVGRGFILIR